MTSGLEMDQAYSYVLYGTTGNAESHKKSRLDDTVVRGSYIFLGLLFFKAVKNHIKAAWQNALVLGRTGHCIRFARVGHTVCKQQSCTAQHTGNYRILQVLCLILSALNKFSLAMQSLTSHSVNNLPLFYQR